MFPGSQQDGRVRLYCMFHTGTPVDDEDKGEDNVRHPGQHLRRLYRNYSLWPLCPVPVATAAQLSNRDATIRSPNYAIDFEVGKKSCWNQCVCATCCWVKKIAIHSYFAKLTLSIHPHSNLPVQWAKSSVIRPAFFGQSQQLGMRFFWRAIFFIL